MITNATISNLEDIYNLELSCFPIEQAASKQALKERLETFPNHFYLLWDNETLISMINGAVTVQKDLTDEMYEDSSLHTEQGDWQMIFGVDTNPAYRKCGYASQLMEYVIQQAKLENRKGIVLTCLEEKIPFYEKFGYVNEGISNSVHGDVTWYQMRITF